MNRIAVVFACLSTCLIASAGGLRAAQTMDAPSVQPKAVVELFTSQGCSSCVSADKYFSDLAKRSGVVALSLHVDYWDYLGWHDTLGDAANTERQRGYAAAQGTSRIYTPQIVVNGGDSFVGSDRPKVDAALERATLPVPVTMRPGLDDGTVEIEVGGVTGLHVGSSTIRLVLLTSEAEVAIERGENAGSTIDYYNVVRDIRPVGMWDGNAVKITLPQHEIMHDGVDACAIIVQEDRPDGPGAIIGAALLSNW